MVSEREAEPGPCPVRMVRRTGSIGTAMHQRVTTGTQSNQILLGIITALAAKLVVNLQI